MRHETVTYRRGGEQVVVYQQPRPESTSTALGNIAITYLIGHSLLGPMASGASAEHLVTLGATGDVGTYSRTLEELAYTAHASDIPANSTTRRSI